MTKIRTLFQLTLMLILSLSLIAQEDTNIRVADFKYSTSTANARNQFEAKAFGAKTGKTISFKLANGNNKSAWAGTISGELNNTPADFYCIDLFHNLATNTTYINDGPTQEKISYILTKYYPYVTNNPNATGNITQEAAAVQAAIWHFSDGIQYATINDLTVRARATEIVNDANANYSSHQVPTTLTISPAAQSIAVPNSASVTATVLDELGDPIENISILLQSSEDVTIVDNTIETNANGQAVFSLSPNTDLSVTLTASADVVVPQGTRFVNQANPTGFQQIVLATPTLAHAEVNASILWHNNGNGGACELTGFTTYTQGGWGSPSNSTPGGIRDAYFDTVFPNGLTIGGTNTLTLTSAQAVRTYIPDGGTAGALTQNYTNPTGSTSAGVLASQLVALTLNIEYSEAGYLGTPSSPMGDLFFNSGPFNGMTLNNFLALANQAVGGDGLNGYTFSQFNDAATSLNENFDNGTVDLGDFSCTQQRVQIRPILECVVDNGNGTYTAHFGYLNQNSFPVTIPVGPNNKFTGISNIDQGQPVTFNPGRTPYFPDADFQVTWDGSTNLVWSLDGKTSTAGIDGIQCSEHVYFEKKWFDEFDSEVSFPSNVPSNYEIVVTSLYGTATGTVVNGAIEWTYSNQSPATDNNGLWVPINSSYTVVENNLPADFEAYAGVGQFSADINGGYAVNPHLGFQKYALHTVKNKQLPQLPTTEHIYFDKKWFDENLVEVSAPVNDLPTNFKIVATSSLGSAEGVYSNGTLVWTYVDNNNAATDGLLVTVGETYTVTEVNLSDNFESIDGIGTFESEIPYGYAENTNQSAIENGYHLITNKILPPQDVDIEVEKTSSSYDIENGGTVTFTITVTNNGPGKATNVTVGDLLPAGLEFVSKSSNDYDELSGVWTIGSLEANESVTLTITTTVNVDFSNSNLVDLGQAAPYNVFIFDDISQPSSDTEGKMAVGRDAFLSNYSVGDKISQLGGYQDVLVVNRDFHMTSGRIYGNVVYGRTFDANDNHVDGTITKAEPIDFTAAKAYLRSLSSQFKQMTANGTVTVEWGQLNLVGTDPYINVFNVSESDFTSTHTKVVSAPNGSVVIVNVAGKNLSWTGGLTIEGTTRQQVIYNFHNARTLDISGIAVEGTILAPKAHVNFSSGQQNGQMIAKSLEGSAQFNNSLFVGNVPADQQVVNTASLLNVDQNDLDEDNNVSSVTVNVSSDDPGNGNGNGNGTGETDNNWQLVGSFDATEIVWSMTTDENGNKYIGTIGGNIYKIDGNNEKTLMNEDMNVGWIWSLYVNDNGRIFAGTEQGVFRSNENQTSWTQKLVGTDVRSLVKVDRELYIGTWGGGVYKLNFNTEALTAVNDGLDILSVHALVSDSKGDIYAGTMGGGVYKYESNTWTKLEVGYNFIWSLAITSDDKLVAATYGDGVYGSFDYGQSWEKINNGLAAQFVYAVSVDQDDNIYASTWAGGVYKLELTNKTNSWKPVGMGGYGVSSIMFNNSEEVMYVGTRDGQIFKKTSSLTGLGEESEIPTEFNLAQNYPNPFNPTTKIEFSIPKAGAYSLVVYNILGQEVRVLANEEFQPGKYTVDFNATDLTSGIYIYRFIGQDVNYTKKMVLIK